MACSRCGLGCAVVYGGQRAKPRASGEKGAEDVLPSWRSMRSLAVKETALGLRSGSLAVKGREHEVIVCLEGVGVKRNRVWKKES